MEDRTDLRGPEMGCDMFQGHERFLMHRAQGHAFLFASGWFVWETSQTVAASALAFLFAFLAGTARNSTGENRKILCTRHGPFLERIARLNTIPAKSKLCLYSPDRSSSLDEPKAAQSFEYYLMWIGHWSLQRDASYQNRLVSITGSCCEQSFVATRHGQEMQE